MSNYKSNLQTNNSALSANNTDLQSLIEQANALPDAGGVELPKLSNTASAGDILSGKEAIDGEGNKITGNFSIDNELNTQDSLISQIQDAVNGLPEAGSSGGGATVEAWTGTISIGVIGGNTLLAYYTDESMVYRAIEIPYVPFGDGTAAEMTIAANTIIYIDNDSGLCIDGENIDILHDEYACLPTANNFEIILY